MYRNFAIKLSRAWSTATKNHSEQQIRDLLAVRFPQAHVNVVDISGGCGAMFDVSVEAYEFKGLSILKQHKLITETLKDKIKDLHGVRIHTTVPEKSP